MTTSLQKEILVILNPSARGEKARLLKDNLESLSNHASIRLTSGPHDASRMARQAVEEGFGTIVAAGGDGTINEIINGLAGSPTRLGILPLGTVNVLARELGLPLDFESAWNVILNGSSRSIDLATVNDTWFVQMAGIGLDAQTIKETTREFKKLFGPMSYVFNATRIAHQKAPKIILEFDDGSTAEGSFCLIGNGRFYGGSFPFFEIARNDDGLLDVCLFEKQSLMDVTRYFTRILSRTLGSCRDVHYRQVRSLKATAPETVHTEVDGEFHSSLPATFTCHPHALNVIVPIS